MCVCVLVSVVTVLVLVFVLVAAGCLFVFLVVHACGLRPCLLLCVCVQGASTSCMFLLLRLFRKTPPVQIKCSKCSNRSSSTGQSL